MINNNIFLETVLTSETKQILDGSLKCGIFGWFSFRSITVFIHSIRTTQKHHFQCRASFYRYFLE